MRRAASLGAIYFFVVLPLLSFVLLHGAPPIGLAVVPTALWGGILVTMVVATVGIVVSLPLGILLALGRRSEIPVVRWLSVGFIEFVRGVPLITVLFMASVMLPLFVPERFAPDKLVARADRRRPVCFGLYGRSGAGRACRRAARPIRGGAGARARLIGG